MPMNIKEIESILLQNMEEVKGGAGIPKCECTSGAHQGEDPDGKCICDRGAAQSTNGEEEEEEEEDQCESGFIDNIE